MTMLKELLIGAAAVTSMTGVSAGQSSTGRAAPRVKNVVLVHGAYADGSSYAKVIPLLRAKGLHVVAVQNPLSSLADDVAATKRAIALLDGPVILVGHSSAGIVITEAGNDPKVVGLVYISAIVPDDGQAAEDALKGYPATPGGAQQKVDSAGYLSLTRRGVDEDFVPDLPPAERAIVYATQGDWHATYLKDKVTTAAWKTKPSWFVVVNDRMVPPTYERDTAKRIKATTIMLNSGHVPMLSRPNDVAAVIIDATTKAGSE